MWQFSNISQMVSKRGKNVTTFLFLPRSGVICDLLLQRRNATWNLQQEFWFWRELSCCLPYIRSKNQSKFRYDEQINSRSPCFCPITDDWWRQHVARIKKWHTRCSPVRHSRLTTLWYHLWSTTEQTHGNIASICWMQSLSKVKIAFCHSSHSFFIIHSFISIFNQLLGNKNSWAIQTII